jgi:sugar transferase (PEP-CTERM/EpsH1 system associated)
VRVLFLTHRLPYAPNRGDRIRAFHILRTLAPRVQLEVVSLAHDDDEVAHAGAVQALGVQVSVFKTPPLRNYADALLRLGGTQPLTHLLLNAPGLSQALEQIVRDRPPDVVLAYCSGMARFALESPLSRFPLVVDLVDVDSQKWAALALSSSWPKRWIYRREAEYLARFERLLVKRAHATLVVNERERDVLHQVAPEGDIRVVPVGVDLQLLIPPSTPEERPRIVFCGVMNYRPNVDGVLWFARNVWPLVLAGRPDAQFVVVGSNPTAEIQRLASADTRIDVTGTVADVRQYLWESAVAVAPLIVARGVQTKVFEAVGAGLPAVVTPQVLEGLPASMRTACRVGESPLQFANEVLSLLQMTGGERRAVAAAARMESLSWESQLRSLRTVLTDAAGAAAVAV